MKVSNWSSLITIFILLLSCSKSELKKEPEVQAYKSSIKSCACINDQENNYRLEATINGEKLCFNRKQRPAQPDFWAITSWDSSIRAERYNIDSTLKMRIQFKNPRFHTGSLPYRIDSSNVQYCETVFIELLNLRPYKFCEGCIADDSYYTALSSTSNLYASILSFKDSVIEGTFEGDFNNRSPEKFKVTNGYFKIRLERRQ